MSFVNYSTREINVKIVYYGPGLSGKTANLQHLYSRAPSHMRGRLISLATETERTLFFDFLPMNLGTLRGFRVRFHLYTVPGQVFYEASRKLILKGVDGLLFVADSDPFRLDANVEAWEGLHRNLQDYGLSIPPLPAVIQYNKRDVPGAVPVPELCEALGNPDLPQFESVATEGTGVFESLKALARVVLHSLQTRPLQNDSAGFSSAGLAANPVASGGAGDPREEPPVAAEEGSEPAPPDVATAPTPGPALAGESRRAPAPAPPREQPDTPVAARGEAAGEGMPPAGSKAVDPTSAARPGVNKPAPVRLATEAATSRAGAGSAASRPNPPPPAREPGEKRRGFGWFRRSR